MNEPAPDRVEEVPVTAELTAHLNKTLTACR